MEHHGRLFDITNRGMTALVRAAPSSVANSDHSICTATRLLAPRVFQRPLRTSRTSRSTAAQPPSSASIRIREATSATSPEPVSLFRMPSTARANLRPTRPVLPNSRWWSRSAGTDSLSPAPSPVQGFPAWSWQVVAFSAGGDGGSGLLEQSIAGTRRGHCGL